MWWKNPSLPAEALVHSFSTSTTTTLPPVDDGAGQPGLFSMAGHGGVHDAGGVESLLGTPLDLSDPSLEAWEQETHALLIALVKQGYSTTDELRRNIESMGSEHYIARSYYCKWATSMALGLIERGVISYSELDQQLLGTNKSKVLSEGPAFSVGQRVRVHSEQSMTRWRKPHLRVPGYIYGVSGIVESYEGSFPDPSYKAFRSMLLATQPGSSAIEEEERNEHLYRVRFLQEDVWPEGKGLSSRNSQADNETSDTIGVEIYENWLVDSSNSTTESSKWEMDPAGSLQNSHSPLDAHAHSHHHHDHDHDHEDDHEHLPRADLEQKAVDLELSSTLCSSGSIDRDVQPTDVVGDRLSAALIALLSKPERLGSDLRMELRKIIDAMESIGVRADGTSLVVRAWTDPAFEQRLLEDAAAAALEMGIQTANATTYTKLKVVKSELPTATQPGIHNLITCTLCSCYPLSLLGLSPKWYKSRSYRARAVREPRAMLRDSFGLDLAPTRWTVRVHDSTADLRYLVLPPRPPNTEDWTEEDLRKLVTRDTMIGVALPDGIPSHE
jgi:nitrile hydratase